MGTKWTRSRLRDLYRRDAIPLEDWVREHADYLYTWLIYHFGLSPSLARQEAASIFYRALEQLDSFRAQNESMDSWLKSLADQTNMQDGQPEPAWAGLEDQAIESLVRLGEKKLSEQAVEQACTADLVRAAVTQMQSQDREVLLARYHRFQTGVDPADAVESDSEKTQSRLVRARYEFRLNVYKLIKQCHSSVSPLSPTVQLDIFEFNLEQLFHSLDPCLHLAPEDTNALIQSLARTAARLNATRQAVSAGQKSTRIVIAAAAGLTVCLIGIIVIFTQDTRPSNDIENSFSKSPQQQGGETVAAKAAPKPEPQETDRSLLEEQLEEAFRVGLDKDIPALVRILQEGPFSAQIVAAHFLGQYGDAEVINDLQKVARQQYSDLEDNPFLKAIETIEVRLSLPAPEEEEEPIEPSVDVPEEPEIKSETPQTPERHEPNLPVMEIIQEPNELFLFDPEDPNYTEYILDPETGDWIPLESPEEMEIEEPNQQYLLDTLQPVPAGAELQ